MSDTTADPRKHRRSIRLKDHDYNSGVFFITICVEQRVCVLGEVDDGQMALSEVGQIAQACWDELPDHFKHVICDAFVIMPNHVHMILAVQARKHGERSVGAQHAAPLQNDQAQTPRDGIQPGSLAAVIRSYKSAVTKQVNELWGTLGAKFWQRSYYERVIRNDDELKGFQTYIVQNPQQWIDDEENPRFYP